MNTKSARASNFRHSFAGLLALAALIAAVPGAPLAVHARRSDPERPEWIAQPKSSDMMYLYVVGHAAGQSSESDAQEAAFRNALQKIAAQIEMPDGQPLPPSRIRRAEVVPGCQYVEEKSSKFSAWVQVSWPTDEKKKLQEQTDRRELPDKPKPIEAEPSGVRGVIKTDSSVNAGFSTQDDKVENAPGRAKAGESQPSNPHTGNSLQFSRAAEPGAPVSTTKTITYSGKAEADGRSAQLSLTFRDGRVSGRLQAQGESGPNISLPTTDISFQAVPLPGPWEDRATTIQANWTGGDYGNGGQIMQDYPTKGTLTIKLAEREGREVVYLHRLPTSRYGYVFPLQGRLVEATPSSNNSSNTTGSGSGDPVGIWTGELKPKSGSDPVVLSYEMTFLANGSVSLITKASTSKESSTLQGAWRSANQAVEIQWSKESLEKWNVDGDTAKARFNGPDCLIFNTGDGPINFSRKGSKSDAGTSGANPFDGKLKEPAFCASINNRERWTKAREFLPDKYSLSDNEAQIFGGVIHLNIKQKQTLSVGIGQMYDLKSGKPQSGIFTPDSPPNFFADPSRVFSARNIGNSGIEVEGVGKGVGKLCVQMDQKVTTSDGTRAYGKYYAVFVIVVHEKTEVGNPEVEIQKLEMTGQAIRKDNSTPVKGAIVSLVYISKSGELLSYGPYPNPTTDAAGKFKVNVGNLPKGRFEVLVQLLGQVAGTEEGGIGVENDLWPWELNVLDLTPELAERSPLNVGVIVLERVKLINNFDNRPLRVIAPLGR